MCNYKSNWYLKWIEGSHIINGLGRGLENWAEKVINSYTMYEAEEMRN